MRLTIDTAQLRYLWRRFVHALRGCPVVPGRCSGCGKPLNADERRYYEFHCEQCAPMYMWDGE